MRHVISCLRLDIDLEESLVGRKLEGRLIPRIPLDPLYKMLGWGRSVGRMSMSLISLESEPADIDGEGKREVAKE